MTELIFFIIGTIFGSFFGLMIDRLPEQSIISPRSHCGTCGKTLAYRDLIPIISQLLHHSKCRTCGSHLPIWYAVLEFSCGLLFTIGLAGKIDLITFIILVASILLTGFDLKSHSFPLIIWLIFFVILCFSSTLNPLIFVCLALAIGAEFFPLKIGSGDFLYLSLLCFSLTFFQLNLVVLFASLAGIGYYLITKKKQEIAFLPFLFLGFSCVLLLT
jgi:leader peptidase (prepilin peptidase)/N-methyltransferase